MSIHEKLLDLAILQHDPKCRWRLLVDRMNQLGPKGCRRHKAELIKAMAEFYGDRSDLGNILEDSIKRSEIFDKHQRRAEIEAAEFNDFGHRLAIRSFAQDWRHAFRAEPPADILERFSVARLAIFGGAKCGSCCKQKHWLADDTREALAK